MTTTPTTASPAGPRTIDCYPTFRRGTFPETWAHRNCFVNPDNAQSFIDDWKAASPTNWRKWVQRLHDNAQGLLVAYKLRDWPEVPLVEQAIRIYAAALEEPTVNP